MTDSAALLRSFVAVPLPGAVQAALFEAAGALARELPGVTWSRRPGNLHVTVKFLGPVASDRLDTLAAALGEAFARVPSFGFGVRGWGAFPSARDAKVLFAAIDEAGDAGEGARGLAEVAEVVESVSGQLGFQREARRFTGHVTVGRCKQGVDARAALERTAGQAFGAVRVDEVHVYESQLGGEGSTYVLRHRARLSARAN
jgi:RNA 2',3'-cyclic 3'-phosphodiesterase